MRTLNSYLRPHNCDIDERFHQLTCYNVLSSASFSSFLDMVSNVDGDIVECGIGRSRSLIILCSLVAGLGLKRRIVAYDSFAGFPEPGPEDASSRAPRLGEWAASPSGKYAYTEEFCLKMLSEAEVPLQDISLKLVEGFFGDTLPHDDCEKIALLNIDGDLYQSYKDCMENLYQKVSPGGIILFDDFSEECSGGDFPGSLAVKEFLGEKEYSKIIQNRFGVFYYQKPY